MKEGGLSKQQQKDRIRERYKGVDPAVLEVIPAKKQPSFYDDVPRRVAVYVRVSTDNINQTSSYELQKTYYEDMVQRHENWTLTEIYADEGISGTSLKNRDEFVRMIRDCKEGKIDLIVTKSVSRFARNIVDCIGITRELKALRPPVGVFFETEHLYTLNNDAEMALSFQATMAQEESHTKSNIMNASIEMRFSHGIVLTPVLLGYDHDEDGDLVINEEEAKIVRLIFFMYLYGYTCQQIAETLTKLGYVTKRGRTVWSPATILQHLRNERYCGDVLTRKTYTPSYLNHKSKKNYGDRTQHRWKNHHEAIISMDDFIAVQHLIDNAKYGNRGILPELQVIREGALKGFVSVNPRWAGFRDIDYEVASESVYGEGDLVPAEVTEVEANRGEFDFRGFEIARAQFFDSIEKTSATFTIKTVKFNKTCLQKLDNTQYIELLIHPGEQLLAVRKAAKDHHNAMHWASPCKKGGFAPRFITGVAFLKTIYALFGWEPEYRYRVQGVRRHKNMESVLLFDMKETEVYIPKATLLAAAAEAEDKGQDRNIRPIVAHRSSVMAYPSAWADNFGSNYYRHSQARELAAIDNAGVWQISEEAQPISTTERKVTPPDELVQGIHEIIDEKIQEVKADETIRTEGGN